VHLKYKGYFRGFPHHPSPPFAHGLRLHPKRDFASIHDHFRTDCTRRKSRKGVRAWNCRITAASIPGIEIANDVHPSGTQ
jgi:hypothetical protein